MTKITDKIRRLISPIPLKMDIQGNWDNEKGHVVIGCTAGPESDIENAFHEIGHLVITNDDNLIPSWGLRYRKWVECPVLRGAGGYYDIQTCQDVRLEARVWAMQAVLMKKNNMKVDIKDQRSH